MENKIELSATVKSPSKSSHLRNSRGFSLKEIKEAGKDVNLLKSLNINIDYMRKSSYPENIDALKKIKVEKKKSEKKKQYTPKEKQRTAFKPKKEKSKVELKKPVAKLIQKQPVKEKGKPTKKEKAKAKKIDKAKEEVTGCALTELSGLGAATAKKLIELGVDTVETLCEEDPEELSQLIKGVSAERLKKWIEEGNELVK
ncbi:MAG: helix-hairpin-helix domain-containing protein [Promethearchaeota archaeon]|jgi:predicted flap endonuclease-1-like 5' DNA nuclease